MGVTNEVSDGTERSGGLLKQDSLLTGAVGHFEKRGIIAILR